MGDPEVEEVLAPDISLRALANDKLVIALDMPAEELAQSGNGAAKSKPEPAPEDSEAEKYRKRLERLELELTLELSRLESRIGAAKSDFERVATDHIATILKIERAAEQATARVLDPIRRLREHLNHLDEQHRKAAAKSLPSAVDWADQIAQQDAEIAKAEREGRAVLGKLTATLESTVSEGQAALAAHRKAQDAARAKLDKLAPATLDKLNDLFDTGFSIAGDLLQNHAGILAMDDPVAALAEMENLEKIAVQAVTRHAESIAMERELRREQFDAVKAGVKPPSWFEGLLKTARDKVGAEQAVENAFWEPLKLAEDLFEKATSADAMKAAIALAQQSAEMFRDYSASEAELKRMSELRPQISAVLNTYQEDRPKDFKSVKSKFDKLEKGWPKMKPSEAAAAYVALAEEIGVEPRHAWDNFRGRCEVERKWREDFRRSADEIKVDFRTLDANYRSALGADGREGYQGEHKATLRALEASAEVEAGSEAELKALTARLREIQTKVKAYLKVTSFDLRLDAQYLKGVSAELATDQAEGMKTRNAFLARRKEVAAAYRAAVAEYDKLKDEKYSEDEKREYKDVKAMLDKAEKMLTDKPEVSDFQELESAFAIAERCKKRLLDLGKAGSATDRGKLGRIQIDFDRGREIFRTDVAALVTAVKTLTDAEPAEVAEGETSYLGTHARVEVAADIAMKHFARIDLSAEAQILAPESAQSPEKRKRARESALLKVRDAMAFLLGNPATRLMMQNKFSVPVGRAFYTALRRIELEVLRGA